MSIRLANVSKDFGNTKVLSDISVEIEPGEFFVMVGPSGSGKTTVCNLIARFWDVNAGKITIGGTDIRDFKLDTLMKNGFAAKRSQIGDGFPKLCATAIHERCPKRPLRLGEPGFN